MLSPGQVLDDRYEILALLAEGGMGAVYRARRTLLGDEVAIKIVRGEHSGSGPRDRFFRESRASARLRHPHIVSILDFNVDDEDHPFLVMELLNGPSMKDELAAKGRMSLAEVQAIVPSLCAALQFAHDLGIVHRDLKPANIVAHEFAPGQRVYKVVDFGLANLRETQETRLTGPHEFLGTIAYASPEQLTGAVVDARSDVYSLGTVVFEMLTGRVPFGGPDAMAMLTAHLNATAPKLSETLADIPAWVDIAVSRALARDPEERWSSIADFGHALLAGDGGSTTVIRSGAAPGRPAGDLRSRRADRPRPARERRLSRHPSRARPPGRDPAAAPRHPAQLGGRAREVHARGAGAPGGAPVDHPGARLR